MRTSATVRTGQNATADDCARLWKTLTTEYIPGVEIRFKFVDVDDPPFGIMLELVSRGLPTADGSTWEDVWATKTFWNPIHLISWGGLFDLLITGYRQIDDFFTHGEQYSPLRRRV